MFESVSDKQSNGAVVELVYTLDSEPSAARHVSSILTRATNKTD